MKYLAPVALAMLSTVVSAQETDSTLVKADPDLFPTIGGNVELGAIITGGNTKSTTYKLKIDTTYETEQWRNQIVLDAFGKTDTEEVKYIDEDGNEFKRDEDTTSAERYFASGQANYKLEKETDTLFAYGSYEKDRFAGFDYIGTVAVGWGRRWYEDQNSHLYFELGPGFTREKSAETKETTDSAIVRLNGGYEWKITDTTVFKQTISSNVATKSGANTQTKAESSLRAQIYGKLSMKLGFLVKHNTEPDDDNTSTDTETTISVVYAF